MLISLSSSIPSINVACVYFLHHIFKRRIKPICNNNCTLFLKLHQVIDDLTAEESTIVWQRGFIDKYRRPFGLNSLHHSLNRRLTEVITSCFHGQPIDTDNDLLFFVCAPFIVFTICSGKLQHTVCNKIFPCTIGFHNGDKEGLL